MINEELNNKLFSMEYNFLRADKHLGNNIILLTTGGSHAYGTNVETSDLDIRGITIEGKQEVLGLNRIEQYQDDFTDTTIYALRKYITLALNCNPNVIEILGTKPEHIFHISPEGKMLKDNVDLFLSQKAVNSFGGYAIAQLRRLENALARDEYPQPEKEKHILKTLESQMYHFMDTYTDLTGQAIKLYLDKSAKKDFDVEIFMDLDLTHYPLRDFKGIYAEMSNIVKDYGKLNQRNKKKDDEHLYKHAMHLIRLYLMGIEILECKGVNTYRENDKGLLLEIRNEKYSFEEIFEMATEYEKKFKYAMENTSLPAKPNYKRVEELLIEMYERRFSL